MKKTLSYLILCGMMVSLSFLAGGCDTIQKNSGRPALTLVEPATQEICIDEIPVPEYVFKGKNKQEKEQEVNFVWPWYVAIGGKITNESGVFERAAAGQIDQSTVVGLATRKYFLWSAYRSNALRVAMRDSYDWNEIRKVLMEVSGEGNILTKLTALPQNVIESQVFRNNIPPELFVTGALTEVTVGEESSAAGVTFFGGGLSSKVVQTSVAGSLEITDPYTGELLISVMGQNRITARQIGAEVFRIVSFNGNEEYLNIEYTTAREIIKQQVQVELVDFLFYKAFKKLIEARPEYLTQRLHYRVGRIQYFAEDLAKNIGLSDLSSAIPVDKTQEQVIEERYEQTDVQKSDANDANQPASPAPEDIPQSEQAPDEQTGESVDAQFQEDSESEPISREIDAQQSEEAKDEQINQAVDSQEGEEAADKQISKKVDESANENKPANEEI